MKMNPIKRIKDLVYIALILTLIPIFLAFRIADKIFGEEQ
jgi:hypothetical protein